MSTDPTSERIDQLLSAFAAGGPVARERAEELVRLVTDLHGDGLRRVLELVDEQQLLTDELLERFAADELVSGLLLVHDLHPHDLPTRVERALQQVRPYLASHGGDVELVEIVGDDAVRLRLLGNCQGCASSAATLELAVQAAVEAAAPEIESIECDDGSADDGALISAESLLQRARSGERASGVVWQELDLAGVEPGQVRAVSVAGVPVVVCRVAANSYAYRDECARCAGDLGAGQLRADAGVLVCPHCRAGYDVRSAGTGVDHPERLEPLPLLEQDGAIEVAVPAAVHA
ncbi:NifU family protein [Saccharopolyspora sp. HNM0983]|uniref:NifU family protein n=1 Tax=Saccharopolyspora montiporae TaxID=2781240 RepID=A0A929FYP3_9PSEU|nr:NifU family protein [Saccharopolyspora sp. HNM0983]MBE9376026.1 NifU family protein [Saccharopolyspora sp. HNM0983]